MINAHTVQDEHDREVEALETEAIIRVRARRYYDVLGQEPYVPPPVRRPVRVLPGVLGLLAFSGLLAGAYTLVVMCAALAGVL